MALNPFVLAADGSEALLPLLHSNPSLAHTQDESGYSLLHALTSYNHLSLLQQVMAEFRLDVGMVDDDGETALFVTETVEAARMLVEDLHVDPDAKNHEGLTAEEKIREEGEFVAVSDYLHETRVRKSGVDADSADAETGVQRPPPLPKGVKIDIGTMQEDEQQEPDQDFKRRIEELAAREDFNDENGQAQLRELVRDAVKDVAAGERETRRRTE